MANSLSVLVPATASAEGALVPEPNDVTEEALEALLETLAEWTGLLPKGPVRTLFERTHKSAALMLSILSPRSR